VIYLDASALVTLVTRRPYTSELRGFLADLPEMPLGTSTIGFISHARPNRYLSDGHAGPAGQLH
jgi:uncharacterized protein